MKFSNLSYLTKLFKVGFDLLVRELRLQLSHVHFALLCLRLLHGNLQIQLLTKTFLSEEHYLFAFYCVLLCRHRILQTLHSLEHHERKPPARLNIKHLTLSLCCRDRCKYNASPGSASGRVSLEVYVV